MEETKEWCPDCDVPMELNEELGFLECPECHGKMFEFESLGECF